jgi:hypothetical protein
LHDRTFEPSFAPADGFPADATLTRLGGLCAAFDSASIHLAQDSVAFCAKLRGVKLLLATIFLAATAHSADTDTQTLRVFIFAGQSNMVGTHSRVKDIHRFPPFAGLDQPQKDVLFSYKLGRENMETSQGWIPMQPTRDYFGPELSFAKKVSQNIEAPIAVIKVASGGTTLGKDWNPDMPDGFKLYPLALDHVRASLAELERKKIAYRIEGVVWHQGENDMFDKAFKPAYAANLKNFIACWRRDLKLPNLRFYLGELCTKTIWGMDNRDNMLAIRTAQKAVADADPLVDYVPTNHDAVEIGGEAGLHYHYGTLGQLEHGVNHADAYLRTLGIETGRDRPLKVWPYAKGSSVKTLRPRRTSQHGGRTCLPTRTRCGGE